MTEKSQTQSLFVVMFSSGILQLNALRSHQEQLQPSSVHPERTGEGGLWCTISFITNGTSTFITLAAHQTAHCVQSGDDDLQGSAAPATTVPLRTCRRLQTIMDTVVIQEGPVDRA